VEGVEIEIDASKFFFQLLKLLRTPSIFQYTLVYNMQHSTLLQLLHSTILYSIHDENQVLTTNLYYPRVLMNRVGTRVHYSQVMIAIMIVQLFSVGAQFLHNSESNQIKTLDQARLRSQQSTEDSNSRSVFVLVVFIFQYLLRQPHRHVRWASVLGTGEIRRVTAEHWRCGNRPAWHAHLLLEVFPGPESCG